MWTAAFAFVPLVPREMAILGRGSASTNLLNVRGSLFHPADGNLALLHVNELNKMEATQGLIMK